MDFEFCQFTRSFGLGPVAAYLDLSAYIDGLMQKRRNSSALAKELRPFCIKLSISFYLFLIKTYSCGHQSVHGSYHFEAGELTGRYFVGDFDKWIFLNESFSISVKILVMFVVVQWSNRPFAIYPIIVISQNSHWRQCGEFYMLLPRQGMVVGVVVKGVTEPRCGGLAWFPWSRTPGIHVLPMW